MPIISNGIIAYRKHPETRAIEYLMIRRKDSLGLMDFIRGKYSVYNKYYIMNMIFQMTDEERMMLVTKTFDEISMKIWNKEGQGLCPLAVGPCPSVGHSPSAVGPCPSTVGPCPSTVGPCPSTVGPCPLPPPPGLAHPSVDHRHKTEESISREKFNQLRSGIKLYTNNQPVHLCTIKTPTKSAVISEQGGADCAPFGKMRNCVKTCDISCTDWNAKHSYYSLESMVNECKQSWAEPEWGFPKGKRNYNESDVDCALREFYEETGFKNRNMAFLINNIAPYEEVFMGSNYKSYKHRYFLMYVDYNASILEKMTDGDTMEISKVEWKPFTEGLNSIRSYNLEKKRVLSNVNIMLTKCTTTIA
jgi:8-oxo-dGTP pyrophosphatase MutT (NUDIX family)